MMTTTVAARPIRSVNPASGETIAEYSAHSPEAIDAALTRTRTAFEGWRTTTVDARAAKLHAMAAAIRAGSDRLAALITAEMGKPIAQAEAEIEKSAGVCEFYADHAADMLAPEPAELVGREAFVQFLPLGPVLAIMPWNYPIWQVMRAAAPILSGGNTLVIKHAESVSGCALALQKIFDDAGLGDGVVQTLLLDGPSASMVIADDRIAAATLTGSERAGVAVGGAAGAALKPCVLELGGSDAFIVVDDADVHAAAQVAVNARFQNTGQSCIAAKRFIVTDAVADEFIAAFTAATKALTIGDPFDRSTDVGPMSRVELRDELDDQVTRAVAHGDTVLVGGTRSDGPGAFYPPTIVEVADTSSPIMQEETFGPVAAVIRVADEDAAIRVANDSAYGLSSALWCGDRDRAVSIAARLDTGGCFINGMTASDPHIPFGGVKRSGFGRELGAYGLREFVNVQTVTIPD
ncbi:NAD-dependent succinate-semialdehyde dehydrogenase [Gordonia hydrophobica]|uniref:NAD-dependent succinate-semialdehyde dehydrogenase n=1 Tax=Gordonia hydrophobica TaxID=40516 RepID=A0ABZ2U2H3_9ACTN|nr:NAD-dependent succinate-semialdehyde dehydrogenase [Gordonia hydrophobica]MBM7369046.1 acyl-CoA reductase-like NAD-dependent aldehyde dehydrogenase [Gordonia hydrophobica]